MANEGDRLLKELNCEYKSKRESGRLGPVQFGRMNENDFINLVTSSDQSVSVEAQFKFLPLYVRTWEAMQTKRNES